MNKKMNLVEVDISGREVVYHHRTVILAVPDGFSTKQLGQLEAEPMHQIEERTEWEIIDSDGVCTTAFEYIIGPADANAEPDAQVVETEDGDFAIQVNENFR